MAAATSVRDDQAWLGAHELKPLAGKALLCPRLPLIGIVCAGEGQHSFPQSNEQIGDKAHQYLLPGFLFDVTIDKHAFEGGAHQIVTQLETGAVQMGPFRKEVEDVVDPDIQIPLGLRQEDTA